MQKFDEKQALLEIKKGKLLSEFHYKDYEWEKEPRYWPTKLMILAILTWHGPDAYKEIPPVCWNQRAAKMAVTANYRAIRVIPDEFKQHCVNPFVNHYLKQDRQNMQEYLQTLREQPETFQSACAGYNPGLSVSKESMMQRMGQKPKTTVITAKMEVGNYDFDFSGDEEFSKPNEITPEQFLSLPAKEQTKEKLEAMLNQAADFPDDFIKRLAIPRRNAMYYEKMGDQKLAEEWKAKIIPYLDLELCKKIAAVHPEASCATPTYLTKEAVKSFWDRKKELCSPAEMTEWFLKFPENCLDEEMKQDLQVTRKVLLHAPSIFLKSEEAKKFLLRNPNAVLSLPEYQTPGFLLLDGVDLNERTVDKIANERFRELVKIALGLHGQDQ